MKLLESQSMLAEGCKQGAILTTPACMNQAAQSQIPWRGPRNQVVISGARLSRRNSIVRRGAKSGDVGGESVRSRLVVAIVVGEDFQRWRVLVVAGSPGAIRSNIRAGSTGPWQLALLALTKAEIRTATTDSPAITNRHCFPINTVPSILSTELQRPVPRVAEADGEPTSCDTDLLPDPRATRRR